jgi:hypothetical protein
MSFCLIISKMLIDFFGDRRAETGSNEAAKQVGGR